MCVFAAVTLAAAAQEFNPIPRAWKWIGDSEALFTFDGTFADSEGFAVNARTGAERKGVSSPAKFSDFPVKPAGLIFHQY